MRYRYSKDIVYNNFVWPEGADFNAEAQRRGDEKDGGLKEPLRLCASALKFATVQKEGSREVVRQVEYYSLEVITSVGYRVGASLKDLGKSLFAFSRLVTPASAILAQVEKEPGARAWPSGSLRTPAGRIPTT